MKKAPLTARRCPPKVHRALREKAKVNRQSINGQGLAWLQRQAPQRRVTGKEAAALLRKFQKMLTPAEHKQIAAGIEEARRRMAHEHLH